MKKTIIKPATNFFHFSLSELMDWRYLIYVLTRRNIKSLYQNTAIGVVWVGVQSVLTLLIFYYLFRRIGGIETYGIPYPLFAFLGIILWQGYTKGLTHGGSSIITHQHMITKVYFPRTIIPLATICAVGVDLAVNFAIYILIFAFYGLVPNWSSLLSFGLIFGSLFIAYFQSLIVCSISLRFRDAQLIMPFLTQIGMFLMPIFFPLSLVGAKYQLLLALHPMTALIEILRFLILPGYPMFSWSVLFVSGVSMILQAILGIYLFNRSSRFLAELV
jgi:lipopolysaccharide transport system permease protein